MAECVPMAPGEGYQPLVGLQDIKTIKQLSQETVRDILRASQRDSGLKIVTMGQLTDMSGTNDAFNSSICSLEVTASIGGQGDVEEEEKQASNGGSKVGKGSDSTGQKTFHFVIKSPPNQAFIRLMHKLTKPFLNEVTWYLVRFNIFSARDQLLSICPSGITEADLPAGAAAARASEQQLPGPGQTVPRGVPRPQQLLQRRGLQLLLRLSLGLLPPIP